MSTALNTASLIAVLDNEITHLRVVYSTYDRLYCSESDTRKLLSDADAAFFSDLYIVYLHYISVAVSRLLDSEKTGKRSNLTLFTLVATLKSEGYHEADNLQQRLREIKKKAYNFTEPRNQLVSHLDLNTNFIDPGKRPIPSFIKIEFEEFYENVGIFMNDIRDILGMPNNMYAWGMVGHGGGRKLLHRLKTASDCLTAKNRKSP